MIWLVAGIVLFLGIHTVRMVAPGWRESMIAANGLSRWKGIYSVISIVGLVLLIWGFGQARLVAPIIYEPPEFVRHFTLLLMWPALILIIASNGPVGRIKATVKHPMITAVFLWSLGHVVANGDAASVLLFGSFLGWSLWNRASLVQRSQPEFEQVTLIGDLVPIVVGTVIYLWLLLQGHAWLFGVPPV